MNDLEIRDPLFQEAVSAIDAGNVSALERLLEAHPRLARERLDSGEGYFRRPYLLWFVAENPVRNDKLPGNIAQVARAIIQAAEREGSEKMQEQLDYALGLVVSGRVPRECGVQLELIDLLIEAGATPDAGLGALFHREVAAYERLLERGAPLTLAGAICTGREADVARLVSTASAADRQVALTAAALYGKARALGMLIGLGVDLNARGAEFGPHATALHHAVSSGSLDAVEVLVKAGADTRARDRVYKGTPLDWAEYYEQAQAEPSQWTRIAAYLRAAESARLT
jgi:peptide-methionine (S)-S-oxide reductase